MCRCQVWTGSTSFASICLMFVQVSSLDRVYTSVADICLMSVSRCLVWIGPTHKYCHHLFDVCTGEGSGYGLNKLCQYTCLMFVPVSGLKRACKIFANTWVMFIQVPGPQRACKSFANTCLMFIQVSGQDRTPQIFANTCLMIVLVLGLDRAHTSCVNTCLMFAQGKGLDRACRIFCQPLCDVCTGVSCR